MSLINKALKEEQRRREIPAIVTSAPMISMVARKKNDRTFTLLLGFTFMGIFLIGACAAIFHFGSQFLDNVDETGHEKIAQSLAMDDAQATNNTELISSKKFTAETSLVSENSLSSDSNSQATGINQAAIESNTIAPDNDAIAEERIRLQNIVNEFTIQGIRKSGKNTRVFMNGRIQKLGDVLDFKANLKLEGFTDTELVFQDRLGYRYSKPL